MSIVGDIVLNTKTRQEYTIMKIDRTEQATYVHLQNNETKEEKVFGKSTFFVLFGESV